MIKVLLLAGGLRYDVTDDVKNWEDIEISQKRKDFGGITRSFSNKFEFVKNAYTILENEYLENYMKASAVVVVNVLNDSWSYNEKFRCSLDFSTFQSDGNVISINGIDNSVESIINANKSQVYDIPVAELKEKELYYDRINTINRVAFYLNPNSNEEDSGFFINIDVNNMYVNFPLIYGDIDFPVKNAIKVQDLYAVDTHFDSDSDYFIKCITPVKISMRLNLTIQALGGDKYSQLFLNIQQRNNIGSISSEMIQLSHDNILEVTYIDKILEFDMSQNDTLWAYFYIRSNDMKLTYTVRAYDIHEINVSYVGKNKPVNIDAFTPSKILTSLLSKMGVNAVGSFEVGDTPIPWMLAAESIRGFTSAKIHTSFIKFTEFAKAVLGYEYEIQDSKIIFKHLSKFYDRTQHKELEFVDGLDLSMNESLIFSGVDVGYEKKDYDEINGRDEFHFTNSFSTGLSINDNVKKLISPYRADCYGIEFLAEKRQEETKDDSSDNDIFIVDAEIVNGKLVLRRSGNFGASLEVSGVLFPDTIFNAIYSPRRMLFNNRQYIGASTDYLKFTASNCNSAVSIGGMPETTSIPIPLDDRIFRIEDIKIDTVGLSPFPPNYKGVIGFDYKNRYYEGYVSEITEKIGKRQSVSYKLICRKIE